MTTKNQYWILYAIAATILATIAVQLYWNYNNYQLNKQRVSNEIQLSIDNALEEYYTQIAKSDIFTIINNNSHSEIDSSAISNLKKTFNKVSQIKSVKISSSEVESFSYQDTTLINLKENLEKRLLTSNKKSGVKVVGFRQFPKDSFNLNFDFNLNSKNKIVGQTVKTQRTYDSIKKMEKLSTILISMDRDTLEYGQVDSLLTIQLKQKQISPRYCIKHFKNDSLIYTSNADLNTKDLMSVNSKSTYLKPKEQVVLEFENPLKDALKLSISGILISFFLAAAIISCLFYLLHIIKQQKQLAEIKNDLISNMTHEFKTPIATIGVVLESLKNFNALDDKTKTENYLNISNHQLNKLNLMVEKLLETATLDSDHLELHKEHINLTELLQQVISKYEMQNGQKKKTIHFISEAIFAKVDPFHFENALNNIIDNAMKYGGEKISISIDQNLMATTIYISDTGNSLKSINKEKLFEKFYRVPKGNTHDVKGFGIGLYYTKKIIEKHGGTIDLNLNNNFTTFKIVIPNA